MDGGRTEARLEYSDVDALGVALSVPPPPLSSDHTPPVLPVPFHALCAGRLCHHDTAWPLPRAGGGQRYPVNVQCWKGPTRTTEANPWPHTGPPKCCLTAMSQCSVSPSSSGLCPPPSGTVPLPKLSPPDPPLTQLHAIPSGPQWQWGPT